MTARQIPVFLCLVFTIVACGNDNNPGNGHAQNRRGGGESGGFPGATGSTAVPVQVEAIGRRAISEHLEANGTLEAENEVELVARTAGPIVALESEEGDTIRAGQLLARIDDREATNQVAIATVNRDEARLAFERTKTSWESGLVSQEAYDSALSTLQATEAQLEASTIQLAYTEIHAPFDALVVTRHIKLAQYVTQGTALFRISDFIPLLCPIEVPEKDLPRVHVGQPGRIVVEAFSGEFFPARVLRVRPTVDAGTGTVTVTLEVEGKGRLRPGMFASVYLQTATHEDSLVIPRSALVLDSIGDTVFIRNGDTANRREVRLGIREEDSVEVLEGVAEGEEVVVLGQDGLADGTPITVLGAAAPPSSVASATGPLSTMPPEAIEAMRQRMKDRGMSDEEIDERLQRMRQGGGQGPGRGAGGGGSAGGIPPFMEQRIKEASPEELEGIKDRMRQFGMSDERIDEIIKKTRSNNGTSN
jgi:membrane fusion protein (multidrug efflux system)